MASTCEHHHKLTNGVGKCSVPMWCMGCPAGFCDEPAYGERPHSEQFWSSGRQRYVRMDGRYDGYVPGLACPAHGGPEPAQVPSSASETEVLQGNAESPSSSDLNATGGISRPKENE